ncbi:SbmA/BacA-like family transporter [Dankookia sp. GCM10030260]|uniref:SbmA/BacA-like family transporter n=1 Tax=Dankookia sp. GCM10030260 TaxID=3273390 RepID=UPI00361B9F22
MADTEDLARLRPLPARFAAVAGGFWSGPTRWQAVALTAILASLTAAEIALSVRFNTWLGALFDVLDRRAVAELPAQCLVLALLVLGFGLQSGLHLTCRRALQLRWRRWLTDRLAAAWLRRATPAEAVAGAANIDGRIAEDIRIATEEAVELSSSLWQATLLLVIFGGLLWELSGSPTFQVFGQAVTIPGYLVWLALIYALVSGVAAFALGRPLVAATDRRQAAEAEFRVALVRLRDEAPPARRGGMARLQPLFGMVGRTWNGQTRSMARLSAYNAGHGRLTTTFPILAGLPGYFQGVVTLGGLMQGAQAFQQLAAALTWPVTSMERVATWGASAERVLALDAVLTQRAAPLPGAVPVPAE